MELFKQLASLILPSQILDSFDVVKVEQGPTLIEISLDEIYPESYQCDESITRVRVNNVLLKVGNLVSFFVTL